MYDLYHLFVGKTYPWSGEHVPLRKQHIQQSKTKLYPCYKAQNMRVYQLSYVLECTIDDNAEWAEALSQTHNCVELAMFMLQSIFAAQQLKRLKAGKSKTARPHTKMQSCKNTKNQTKSCVERVLLGLKHIWENHHNSSLESVDDHSTLPRITPYSIARAFCVAHGGYPSIYDPKQSKLNTFTRYQQVLQTNWKKVFVHQLVYRDCEEAIGAIEDISQLQYSPAFRMRGKGISLRESNGIIEEMVFIGNFDKRLNSTELRQRMSRSMAATTGSPADVKLAKKKEMIKIKKSPPPKHSHVYNRNALWLLLQYYLTQRVGAISKITSGDVFYTTSSCETYRDIYVRHSFSKDRDSPLVEVASCGTVKTSLLALLLVYQVDRTITAKYNKLWNQRFDEEYKKAKTNPRIMRGKYKEIAWQKTHDDKQQLKTRARKEAMSEPLFEQT